MKVLYLGVNQNLGSNPLWSWP